MSINSHRKRENIGLNDLITHAARQDISKDAAAGVRRTSVLGILHH